MKRADCTGVILAGGLNSRMNGFNKGLLELEGRTVLGRTLSLFEELFEETLVVSNTPEALLDYDVRIVSDIFPERCSLAGIHSALFHANTPWVFVAPCDNPFLSKEMVELVLSHRSEGATCVVPETTKGLEPLCAAYAKETLGLAESRLKEECFKIRSLFRKKRTRYVPEAAIRRIDPDLLSFFNINTPEEYAWAQAMMKEKHSSD